MHLLGMRHRNTVAAAAVPVYACSQRIRSFESMLPMINERFALQNFA